MSFDYKQYLPEAIEVLLEFNHLLHQLFCIKHPDLAFNLYYLKMKLLIRGPAPMHLRDTLTTRI